MHYWTCILYMFDKLSVASNHNIAKSLMFEKLLFNQLSQIFVEIYFNNIFRESTQGQ